MKFWIIVGLKKLRAMGRSSSPTEYLFTRTNSGVKKVPNRTKRLGKASKVVGRGRRFSILLRQACKDAATELSFHVEGEIGGEAVNLIRSNALKSLHTHKDIGQKPAMHIGKCSEYEINTLMAQIYQDLDRAQDSRFAADLVEMAIVKPDDWGERDGRLVSDALEVSNVISTPQNQLLYQSFH